MIQIRSIYLYSRQGQVRTLRFRLGSVNVITGASQKGKSAILDIIDFCTGSRSYYVAEGIIRDTVETYAVEFSGPEGLILAARHAPQAGRSSNTTMYVGYRPDDSEAPDASQLDPNCDLSAARDFLSRAAGINDNLTDPGEGARDAFAANIRHALFFVLQSQSEVANRNLLFHSQGEERIPQAIRDVLPYFLGASDPEYVRKRNALRDASREVRNLERQLSEQRGLSATPRAQALLAEALSVGLVSPREDVTEARSVLQQLTNAVTADLSDNETADAPDYSQAIEQLSGERDELRQNLASLRSQNESLRRLLAAHGNFGSEAGQQVSRLESLGLLRLDREADVGEIRECPVCESELSEPIDGIGDIDDSLRALERDIDSVSQSVPRIQQLIGENDGELVELNARLRTNSLALEQETAAQRDLEELNTLALRRAAIRGRINLYLESVSKEVEDAAVAQRLQQLREEVELLEEALRSDETAARLESAINRVSRTITTIAELLQLEHSEFPARLDARRLTVVLDMRQGPRTLAQIGSAANWLGYHVAVMIGLHQFFVVESRPVPRFFVLDQPSQVYYPQGSLPDETELTDEDSVALARVLRQIYDFVENSEGQFQAIILEHANLPEEWYQDSIIERWRGPEAALIPPSWASDG